MTPVVQFEESLVLQAAALLFQTNKKECSIHAVRRHLTTVLRPFHIVELTESMAVPTWEALESPVRQHLSNTLTDWATSKGYQPVGRLYGRTAINTFLRVYSRAHASPVGMADIRKRVEEVLKYHRVEMKKQKKGSKS